MTAPRKHISLGNVIVMSAPTGENGVSFSSSCQLRKGLKGKRRKRGLWKFVRMNI